MNKIEITVLSARVLDALSGRGLKAKTVHEFERYGTRRIVKHCLGKGQILYSKETVQNFVWNERAKQESGTLPHYQWGITRRAAVYLDQMAEYGKIQDEPIRPWEAEHNPLFQAISCNPSNSMKVIDIICRTRDAVMQLELSDKTKTNYIYCGFGAILNFFISRGEESYSPETLALFEKTVQENFVNGAMQKASFQTMRKAAHWIEEYLSTGQVSQQKLRKYNFACAPPEFENLLSQYQLYMDNENYLKEGSRQFYLSSVRTFFRTIATLGIYRYAEITLPDVTRCLAKISETFPLGILTTYMLNEFVEKIVVHERDRKGSVETTQEVEIYFNFIGRYLPPHFGEVKMTPEEIEEMEKREARKDRLHQNYLRRKANGKQQEYYERTKAKKKAELDAKKEEIRQEDIAKGVFIPLSLLPPAEPKKGVASA